MRRVLVSLGLLGALTCSVQAHPVAREHHDRTILVHVKLTEQNEIEVSVDYRLEVDELTVLLDDMRPYRDEVDPALFKQKPLAYYGQFTRIYAPILAGNLLTRANGNSLKFVCSKRDQRLRDEKGEVLGHLRCDFVFRASFPAAAENVLTFQETNYHDQPGKVDLAFGQIEGFVVVSKAQPDAALKNRPAIELRPGDDAKLRTLELRFQGPPGLKTDPQISPPPEASLSSGAKPGTSSAEGRRTLQAGLGLIMGIIVAGLGVWLLLQRLAGRADHVHLPGTHHHHHGHAHHHHHAEQISPGWWGLIVLGMTGGIVPCWDAIALLVVTVGTSEFWLALPLLLAFSAGLASVLVLIGILVVKARGFVSSRWGEGRLVRSLPYVSAVLITLMGMWLCYDSVNASGDAGDHELLNLFRREMGLGLLLVLAGVLGAAHALTPGHGKTLVAAYLVGQRGTVWHALVLGLVTTLTHTGIVLLIALGLYFY